MKFKAQQNSPNFILHGDGFYISYNPDPCAGIPFLKSDNGCDETALFDGKYKILNGDFREDYERLAPQGLESCLKFYDKMKEKYDSSWTTGIKNLRTNMDNAWLGIDPGQTGAAVLLTVEKILFHDWKSGYDAANAIMEWKSLYNIKLAVLEKVSAMPKQGVSSMFKFGTNYGIWQGILICAKIPYQLLSPRAWQSDAITKTDGPNPKARSLNVARRLYPELDWLSRMKDNGRSDALLMARKAASNMETWEWEVGV